MLEPNELSNIYDKGLGGDDPGPKPRYIPKNINPTGLSESRSDGISHMVNMDVNDYKGYVKNVYDYQDNEALRASGQSNWDKFGNWGARVIVGIGTSLGEGLGHFGGLLTEWGEDRNYENGLTKLMKDTKASLDEAMPVYRRNNKTFDLGDPGWWFNNSESLVSSVAAFAIGGVGIAKGLSMFGKTFQTAKGLEMLTGGVQFGQKANQLMTASSLAYVEGAQMGKGVYDTVYNAQMKKLVGEGLTAQEAHAKAIYMASQSAASAVQLNTILNTGLNMYAVLPFFKHETNAIEEIIKREARQKPGELFADAAARIKGLNIKDFKKEAFRGEGKAAMLREAGFEGLEEVNNLFAERTAIEEGSAGRRHGLISQLGQVEKYFNRTWNEEGLLNFALGAVAGPLTTMTTTNIPIHKVQTGYKTDDKGEPLMKDGQPVPMFKVMTSRQKNKFGNTNYFNNLKDAVASDIDFFEKQHKKINDATLKGNKVLADNLKRELFTVHNRRAVELGFGDNLVQSYQEIMSYDNETIEREDLTPKINELKATIAAKTEKGEATDVEQAELDATVKQYEATPEQTEAMRMGFTNSMKDNEYKKKAELAISDIKDIQKRHAQVMARYKDAEGRILHTNDQGNVIKQQVADIIFDRYVKLDLMQKRMKEQEARLAEIDKEQEDLANVLGGEDLIQHVREKKRANLKRDASIKQLNKVKADYAILKAAMENPTMETIAAADDVISHYGALGTDTDEKGTLEAVKATMTKLARIANTSTKTIEDIDKEIEESSGYNAWKEGNPDKSFDDYVGATERKSFITDEQEQLMESIGDLKSRIETHSENLTELETTKTLESVVKKTQKWWDTLAAEAKKFRDTEIAAEIKRREDIEQRNKLILLQQKKERNKTILFIKNIKEELSNLSERLTEVLEEMKAFQNDKGTTVLDTVAKHDAWMVLSSEKVSIEQKIKILIKDLQIQEDILAKQNTDIAEDEARVKNTPPPISFAPKAAPTSTPPIPAKKEDIPAAVDDNPVEDEELAGVTPSQRPVFQGQLQKDEEFVALVENARKEELGSIEEYKPSFWDKTVNKISKTLFRISEEEVTVSWNSFLVEGDTVYLSGREYAESKEMAVKYINYKYDTYYRERIKAGQSTTEGVMQILKEQGFQDSTIYEFLSSSVNVSPSMNTLADQTDKVIEEPITPTVDKPLQEGIVGDFESKKADIEKEVLGSFANTIQRIVNSKGPSNGKTIRTELTSKISSDGEVIVFKSKNTFADDGRSVISSPASMTIEEFKEHFYPMLTADEIEMFEETLEVYKKDGWNGRIFFKELRVGSSKATNLKGQLNLDIMIGMGNDYGFTLTKKLTDTELDTLENKQSEPNQSEVEAKKADIERRRQEALKKFGTSEVKTEFYNIPVFLDSNAKVRGDKQEYISREVFDLAYANDNREGAGFQTAETLIRRGGYTKGELTKGPQALLKPEIDKINAKYDAELAALEPGKKQTPNIDKLNPQPIEVVKEPTTPIEIKTEEYDMLLQSLPKDVQEYLKQYEIQLKLEEREFSYNALSTYVSLNEITQDDANNILLALKTKLDNLELVMNQGNELAKQAARLGSTPTEEVAEIAPDEVVEKEIEFDSNPMEEGDISEFVLNAFMDTSDKYHEGTKTIHAATSVNGNDLPYDNIYLPDKKKWIKQGRKEINKESHKSVFIPTELKPGTKLRVVLDTTYSGPKSNTTYMNNDDEGKPIRENESFKDYVDANGKVLEEDSYIGNVPIKVINEKGETVRHIRTVDWVKTTWGATQGPEMGSNVYDGEEGSAQVPAGNIQRQATLLLNIRKKLVAQYNSGDTKGVEVKVVEKTAGTTIKNIEPSKLLEKAGKVEWRKASRLLPAQDIIFAISSAAGNTVKLLESKGTATELDVVTNIPNTLNNRPFALLKAPNGQYHAALLKGTNLMDTKSAINTITRVLELHLMGDSMHPEVIRLMNSPEDPANPGVGLDITTVEGLKAFINQFYTHTSSWAPKLYDGKAFSIFGIEAGLATETNSLIRISNVQSSGTTTVDAKLVNGKLSPKFVNSLQTLLKERFKNVVFTDENKGIKGINNESKFVSPEADVNGRWIFKSFPNYNSYIKNHVTTNVYGLNTIEYQEFGITKKMHVYAVNPQLNLDFSNVLNSPVLLPDDMTSDPVSPNVTPLSDQSLEELLDNISNSKPTVQINNTFTVNGREVTMDNLRELSNLAGENRNDKSIEEVYHYLIQNGIVTLYSGFNPFVKCT